MERLLTEVERLEQWVAAQPPTVQAAPAMQAALTALQAVLTQDLEPDPRPANDAFAAASPRIGSPPSAIRRCGMGAKRARGPSPATSGTWSNWWARISLWAPSRAPRTSPSMRRSRRSRPLSRSRARSLSCGWIVAIWRAPRSPGCTPTASCCTSNPGWRTTGIVFRSRPSPSTCAPARSNVPRMRSCRFDPAGPPCSFPPTPVVAVRCGPPVTTASHGRSITLHPEEALLQTLRATAHTPDGRTHLRRRTTVEHSLARPRPHPRIESAAAKGPGRKNTLDVRRCATVANLQRLARLKQAA